MLNLCPDSYENIRKAKGMEDAEDVFCSSGLKANLGSDTQGCAVLDCACNSNVCGEPWLKSYVASLNAEDKGRVVEMGSEGKNFRFGGKVVCPSMKQVRFPAVLAGKAVMIQTHVVKSPIPLLCQWPRQVYC